MSVIVTGPAVIDIILFSDEFELFELRCHELDGVVSHHVVVESDTTFSGQPKPLRFKEWMDSGEIDPRFAQKTFVIAVTDMPPGPNPWVREAWQRNAMIKAVDLLGIHDSDIIMMSDGDEIPKRDTVAAMKYRFMMHSTAPIFPAVFKQLGHYYWLNMLGEPPNDDWYGTRVCQAMSLRECTPQHMRITEPDKFRSIIGNGGWHWSYLGGRDRIRSKVAAFSHHDLYRPEHMNDASLDRCLVTGADLFGRDYIRFSRVDLEYVRYPRYLIENRDKFSHLICG